MDKTSFLTTKAIFPLLIKLSIPTVFAQVIVIAYNLIDRVYIGRLPDSHVALAALGLTFPVVVLGYVFISCFGRGGAPLCSIQLGAKKQDLADQIISNALSYLVISSIFAMICVHVFAEDILYLLGGRGEALSAATDYLKIYNLGTIFLYVGLGLNHFINAQGQTKVAMMAPLLGGISNFILNPIFIFWLDLGVKGAAIATVIAQFISFLWVISFFITNRSVLHIRRDFLLPKWELFKKIALIGSGPAFMTSSESLVLLCFNAQLLHYGDVSHVGSLTIVSGLFMLTIFPMLGLMQGAQPIVSYNYGAKNFARARKAIFYALMLNMSYGFLLSSSMIIFPRFFISMFTNDINLISSTIPMLQIYIAGALFLGIATTCQESYMSLGSGFISLFFAFLRKAILLVPLLYILPHFFEDKIFAIVLAEPVSDSIAGLSNGLFFLYYIKRKFAREEEGSKE